MLLYGRNVTSNLPRRQVIRDLDQLISESIFACPHRHTSKCSSATENQLYSTLNGKKEKKKRNGLN